MCKKCGTFKEKFSFNNVFHNHIRECNQAIFVESFQISPITESESKQIENRFVVEFMAFFITGNGFAFKSYSYVTIWLMVDMQKPIKAIVDSGCPIFFIDEVYLRAVLFNEKSIQMTAPMNVREIENAVDECVNYIVLNIYLNEISKEKSMRDRIHKKFHFVKKLKCKIFLKMSFLAAEQIIINIVNKIMVIPTCEKLIVFIKIVFKFNFRIRRVIHVRNQIFISFKTVVRVSTYMKGKNISNDRDYFFEFDREHFIVTLKEFEDFYFHVCDGNMSCVQLRNDRNIVVNISRRARFGLLIEYEKEDCYQIDDEYHDAAVITDVTNLKKWKQNDEDFFQIIREI